MKTKTTYLYTKASAKFRKKLEESRSLNVTYLFFGGTFTHDKEILRYNLPLVYHHLDRRPQETLRIYRYTTVYLCRGPSNDKFIQRFSFFGVFRALNMHIKHMKSYHLIIVSQDEEKEHAGKHQSSTKSGPRYF